MATLTGSNIELNSSISNLYADYSITETSTTYSINGTVYLKLDNTNSLYNAQAENAGLPGLAISDLSVTCSFSSQSISKSAGQSGSVAVGTFSASTAKGMSPKNITMALAGRVSLTSLPSYGMIVKTSQASVTLTVPSITTYPITYYSNNGTSSTQTQNKYHGVDLTLSPATPTFSGYTFKGWATSIAHAQVGTVDYETGDTYSANAALNLFAVWELTYSKPVITNLTIERCTSSGTLDDEGKYAKVSFTWSVFKSASARYYGGETYPYSNNSVSSCTVTVGSKTKTPTLSGDSGTASVTVGNNTFDVDTQYSASVSITDSQSIVQDKTTTVTGTLSTTAFPLDYNAAGSAAGMFRPAPDNGHGLYVGDDIHSSGDIDASGDMNIGPGKHYKMNGTNLGASDVGAEPTISNISESSGVYSGGIPDEKLLTADTITALEAWLSS